MKNIFAAFLYLFIAQTFAQTQYYDYFVQYNGSNFSKKISEKELTNHPFIRLISEDSISKKEDWLSVVKMDLNACIAGKYNDSVSYYQVSIPIKSKDNLRKILEKSMQEKKEKDSLFRFEITDFEKYSRLTNSKDNYSMAWNNDYLALVTFTNTFQLPETTFPAISDSIYEMPEYKEEEEGKIEQIAPPSNSTDTIYNVIESPAYETIENSENENYDYNDKYADYNQKLEAFDSIKKQNQNLFLEELFANGYQMPTSNKINTKADISSWVDYSKLLSQYTAGLDALKYLNSYGRYLPSFKNFSNFIKGINFDISFENKQVKAEEIIEYSEKVADIIAKINQRKINKNVFRYFPNKIPMGFVSYHINTKEALTQMPNLISTVFEDTSFLKEDYALIVDLITTIVDEDATASLLDGDFDLFLHDIKQQAKVIKTTEYDENYEEIVTEKTINETLPLFSFIFSSSHKTFGDKLIKLGLRKNLLVAKENYFEFIDTKEFGAVKLLKDKEVVVITNFETPIAKNNETAKEIKSLLNNNYFSAQLNLEKVTSSYIQSKNYTNKNNQNLQLFSTAFSKMEVSSPKKIIDNKLKFEINLKAENADKNVLLQAFDLFYEMSTR